MKYAGARQPSRGRGDAVCGSARNGVAVRHFHGVLDGSRGWIMAE
jgi:hypothetical protein